MLRRSIRLQEAGYYTEDGTPFISYKERLYRIFRRRRRINRAQHEPVENQDFTSDHTGNSTWTTSTETVISIRRLGRKSSSSSVRIVVSSFLLFLFLVLGIAKYVQVHRDIGELHQELHFLSHHVDKFLPKAHNMPNFALESQGARVLRDGSSETYWPQENIGIVWNKVFSWWYSYKTQRRVIQGHSSLNPGQCWSFSGERGHLFISLSHPVSITHVTLGHISKIQSLNGYIASAPRKFSIYGMTTADDKGTYLGTWDYDQDGASFQTFKLPDPDIGVFRYVKLQVESNWGNKDHTCVYSFRVHGKLPT